LNLKAFDLLVLSDEDPYLKERKDRDYCNIYSEFFFSIMLLLFFLSGKIRQNGYICGNNEWKLNDIISVEVDTIKKTVHIFINNIVQPVSLCDVPFPLKGMVWLLLGYLLRFLVIS
jgi:hypothetical protein